MLLMLSLILHYFEEVTLCLFRVVIDISLITFPDMLYNLIKWRHFEIWLRHGAHTLSGKRLDKEATLNQFNKFSLDFLNNNPALLKAF